MAGYSRNNARPAGRALPRRFVRRSDTDPAWGRRNGHANVSGRIGRTNGGVSWLDKDGRYAYDRRKWSKLRSLVAEAEAFVKLFQAD